MGQLIVYFVEPFHPPYEMQLGTGQFFVAHFATRQRQHRGSDSLVSMKQQEGEPLREYICHFNVAILEVTNLNQSVAMTALKSGL